jgi:hypothetical protein
VKGLSDKTKLEQLLKEEKELMAEKRLLEKEREVKRLRREVRPTKAQKIVAAFQKMDQKATKHTATRKGPAKPTKQIRKVHRVVKRKPIRHIRHEPKRVTQRVVYVARKPKRKKKRVPMQKPSDNYWNSAF